MADDICLSSGLCLVQMKGLSGLIYQNACTDNNWKSPDCPSICRGISTSGGISLLPCPAKGVDQWCCSVNGTDCCDRAKTVDIGTIVAISSTSSSTTTTPSASATKSASGTETMPVTATSLATNCAVAPGTASDSDSANAAVCSDPNSKTTAIGAGLGAGLGVLLIAALSALWLQRRMYEKKLQQRPESPTITYSGSGIPDRSSPARWGMAELPSQNLVQEIQGTEAK
ncbi:uncharacterized protein ACLA_043960 [Aspergillus clavatus NRRL 1]|uniref:Mid2 domain-containing protein n=1 Tax=Aspergillus clavatus (strain ATCC 1007 / CBS 513.65 / DSM 816 / NCTC 3887 / NRRL 1 / QM 1276 / 107) TaxID=344612 RepID=A1C8N9_ASPCL|nr:uncharacterized protein ACLA_043960 [Aspergillus clavatus NRRL 1]EAW13676.1 conserved hypothetical protein [Aspergillus clavatus NRRL 1]